MTQEKLDFLKAEFLTTFSENIHRDGAEELLEFLKGSDFFFAPASTKFHGNFAGGLLLHSLNVYKCLKKRLELDEKCDPSEETVATVALMHDLCKVNTYKQEPRNRKIDGKWQEVMEYVHDEKFTCGDHSDKSIIILQNFIRLSGEEIQAIRAHMGAFDNAFKGGSQFLSRIFEQNRLAVHLHLADMEATYLMEENDE